MTREQTRRIDYLSRAELDEMVRWLGREGAAYAHTASFDRVRFYEAAGIMGELVAERDALRKAATHALEWFAAFPHSRDDNVTRFTEATADGLYLELQAALSQTPGEDVRG